MMVVSERDLVVLQLSSRGASHALSYLLCDEVFVGRSLVATPGSSRYACSVNLRSCSILYFLLCEARPLICLAQSVMAAMILSACVTVGLVMFL